MGLVNVSEILEMFHETPKLPYVFKTFKNL